MDVVQITQELVSHNSASRLSNISVSNAIAGWMRKAGLAVERLEYQDKRGVPKVSLVGKKGRGAGGLALMGHSDVVPAEGWATDPFKAVERNRRLYGRGCADMKGSIACMVAAAASVPTAELKRPVFVITTGDEEIDSGGAFEVIRRSRVFRSSNVRYGIIGEPTVLQVVHAHKGSFRVHVVARGRAAHSSTGRGVNANHLLIPFLNDVVRLSKKIEADPRYQDETFAPPHSTWNIVMGDGDTASNITAHESRATVNVRPMPRQNWDAVARQVKRLADKHGVQVDVATDLQPLYTPVESRVIQEALRVTGKRKPKTVPYGTDAMAFGSVMELVVMGPGNIQQAHTTNEWISLEQLHKGVDVFGRMVRRFCVEDPK